MARSKPKPATKSPIIIDAADPQSWLYLLSATGAGGMVFGVLRRRYSDRINTAAEFARRKLQPVAPDDGPAAAPWRITAERADVLLPVHAPDAFANPRTLFEAMDQHAVAHQPALLTYATIALSDCARLHQGWEAVRDFAHDIAVTRELAVMVVLHAPGRIAASNAPHAHLLIVPRRIGPHGIEHGTYDEELIHDEGQALLERLWSKHRIVVS